MWAWCVGAASDCGADVRHAELGDGVQEVVSRLQDPHLLWEPEGAQGQETGKRGRLMLSLKKV